MREIKSLEAISASTALYLYGTGEAGRCIKNLIEKNGYTSVIGFIDSKVGGTKYDKQVLTVDDYAQSHDHAHLILICSSYYDEIAAELDRRSIANYANAWPLYELSQRVDYRADALSDHHRIGPSDMQRWHVVGDSHVAPFRWASENGLVNSPCVFTEVRGATAVGLRNPNSQTDAVGIFRNALLPAITAARLVIQIGEVDCGFTIWYRAKKYGESIMAQVEQSIAAYFEFVDELIAGGYKNIVISGATLPTIRDGQDWGEVANARREITTTLLQRTELTLMYNAKLRAAAEHRSLTFIDIAEIILDNDTHIVAENFCHPDPTDHHLDPEKAGPLWAAELNRIDRAIV